MTEVPTPGAISDHDHAPARRGPWRLANCVICGERNNRHLSYGIDVAAAVGGDPLAYVDTEPRK